MTHISSIGAGMFSDLSVAMPALAAPTIPASPTITNFMTHFATEITPTGTKAAGAYIRIKNVREFPSLGTPPNIVNVPGYGSTTSQQIQGQSDAPSMELTLNYIPADWSTLTKLGDAVDGVGSGVLRLFRFTLLNQAPTDGSYASANSATGLSTVGNSQYFWLGKMEALQVSPQLTDANQATLTISLQSQMWGAFTNT